MVPSSRAVSDWLLDFDGIDRGLRLLVVLILAAGAGFAAVIGIVWLS